MLNIVKKINKLTYRETVKQAHEENTLKETYRDITKKERQNDRLIDKQTIRFSNRKTNMKKDKSVLHE
jgi:hypothetical protein